MLACAGFVLSFNVAAASALVPSVATTFGVSEFMAGKMLWLYMLPYGLAALVYGPAARSIDLKKILLACLACFAAANFLAGFSPGINTLFAARILAGISGAAIIPLSLILISQNTTYKERGKKVGGFFSLTFISSLAGLFLSGLLSWRWIFLLPGLGAVLLWIGIYFYFPSSATQLQPLKFEYLQALAQRRIFRLFVYIFLVSFIYHGIRQWLGVYFFKVHRFEQFLISMLLTTISLSGIFGECFGGVLADKIGRKRIVNIGVGLMLLALGMLLFKNVPVALFVIMALFGLGWTFNHAGISTNLVDLPKRYIYQSASLNSSVRFLSGGVGAWLGGILAQRNFNLQFLFFIFCLLALYLFTNSLVVEEESDVRT